MLDIRMLRASISAVLVFAAAPALGAVVIEFEDALVEQVTSITREGVVFSVSGTPATYGGFGFYTSDQYDFLSGRAFELGVDSLLTITFPQPVSFLQFGLAHSGSMDLLEGFSPLGPVTLYEAETGGIGFAPASISDPLATPVGNVTERQFIHDPAGIRRVEIAFPFGLPFDFGQTLALDNLAFELVPDIEPIPEPSTWLLMLAGIASFAAMRRRSARA